MNICTCSKLQHLQLSQQSIYPCHRHHIWYSLYRELSKASGVFFSVPEHGLDVAAQECDEGGRAEAGRHEVEERRLRVLVKVHDADGGEEA